MPDLPEREYLKRLHSGTISGEDLARILGDRAARRHHTVRRALAGHPKTPRVEALSLIPTLFWRDLAWISADARAHPEIRRAADREILRRLPMMALAEKVDLAGCGGPGVASALRTEEEPSVLSALLRNRFMVESDVVYMASRTRGAENLQRIAADAVWGLRLAVKTAAVRNRAAPLSLALDLLCFIPIGDLRDIAAESWRPSVLREGAREELHARVEGRRRLV